MKRIKIIIPCHDIDMDELQSSMKEVEDVVIENSGISNITGELLCSISTVVINIPLLILAFMSYRQGELANRKVEIYDENDNPIKLNIRIKDINRIISDDKGN